MFVFHVSFSFRNALKIILGASCNFCESQPHVSERKKTKTKTQNPHLPLQFADLLFGYLQGDSLRIRGAPELTCTGSKSRFGPSLSSSAFTDVMLAAGDPP